MEPRILIVSEYFRAGDAITTLNLFSKFDKDNLYCISNVDDFFDKNFKEAYLIGNKEIKYFFPFNIFKRTASGGIWSSSTHKSEKVIGYRKSDTLCAKIACFLLSFFKRIISFLGVNKSKYHYILSPELKMWIDSIEPHFIYSAVGSLGFAHFINRLMKQYPNVKFLIHGYDDWIDSPFNNQYKSLNNESQIIMREIFSRATLAYTISDKMSSVYEDRFSRSFYTFCNPVKSLKIERTNDNRDLVITYIGKIWVHNKDAILDIARYLNDYNITLTSKIIFNIYSDINDWQYVEQLKHVNANVFVHKWITQAELPLVLSNSILLLLPISFDEKVIKYTRYSISTKLSEYLSSGVPVLYYGPKEIAMSDFLIEHNCAFVVNNQDSKQVFDAIDRVIGMSDDCMRIINNALYVYQNYFDLEVVAKRFRNLILDSCSNNE